VTLLSISRVSRAARSMDDCISSLWPLSIIITRSSMAPTISSVCSECLLREKATRSSTCWMLLSVLSAIRSSASTRSSIFW
jgi:hypothetical protein